MANVKLYTDIMQSLQKGEIKPVYLLHGEEPYYIDKVSKYLEEHTIEEHERDFNLNIFYGRDLNKDQLLETLRRFPMMAQRQVVIVREAQDFSGKWSEFETYFRNPVSTTVFVIAFKYKTADEKTKWVSAIKQNGVVAQFSKHYDSELPEVISAFTRQVKYRINQRAAHLMAEYLGNDLEKIEMEINKLTISVPLSREIGVDDVQRNIGFSKEFNVFEYIDALSQRDSFKSFRIARFLGQNDKNNPFVLIVNLLFSHYSRVMMYHGLKTKDLNSVMAIPGVRGQFAAKQVMAAAQKYTPRKTAEIISALREFDARFKGVETARADAGDMLKELTYIILN